MLHEYRQPVCILALLVAAGLAGCLADGAQTTGAEGVDADTPNAGVGKAKPASKPDAANADVDIPPTFIHLTNCTFVRVGLAMPGVLAPHDPPPEWGNSGQDYVNTRHSLLECNRIGVGFREFPDALLLIEGDDNFAASRNCTENQPYLIRRVVASSPDLAEGLNEIPLMNATAGKFATSRENRQLVTELRFVVDEPGASRFEAFASYTNAATRTQPEDIDLLMVGPSGTTKMGGEADADGSYIDAQTAIVTYSSNDGMSQYAAGPIPVVADVNRDYSVSLSIDYYGDHACVLPR